MKQITISLRDAELKALLEIKNTKEISSLHKAVKMAIGEYIKRFMEMENEGRSYE